MKASKLRNPLQTASRQYSDATVLMHETIARKAGLTGADHKYLGLMLQHPALTAGDISRLTGLSTGAVTGLIDRLEKKQLVQRQFTQDDRRKVIIVPQQNRIQQLLAPLFEDLVQQTDELMATYTEKEMALIESYFIKATAIMNRVTATLNKT